MPQVSKAGSYWVYFWADEGKPLEPIHVHIAETEVEMKWANFFGTTSYYC